MSGGNRAIAGAVVILMVATSVAWADGNGSDAPGLVLARSRGDHPKVRPAAQKTGTKKPRSKNATAAAEETKPEATPAPAAPDGALKFSRDIAPILVGNCLGCHNSKQLRGKLDLSTFDKIMTGTPSEKILVAGKPEDSHIVLRIKAEETPKMPQGGNRNLSEEAIAKIEQWVKEGAVLDPGIDRTAPLQKYAATPEDLHKGQLAKLPADQRDKKVETVGLERWKKANPKVTPDVTSGAHFLLFGKLPKDRASAAVKGMEGPYSQIRGLLGNAAVEWGEKGSLYVFSEAASYNEFVRLVDNREVEPGETGMARFSVPEPYVAVVDPQRGRGSEPAGASSTPKRGRRRRGDDSTGGGGGGTERSLPGVLSEHFVTGVFAKAGNPPPWLSLGLAAQIASRFEPRSAYYQQLRKDAHDLCQQGWMSKANDALGNATKPEHVRAVGFAILDWIQTTDRSLLPAMVHGLLAGGEKLDEVLGQVFNLSREQFLGQSAEFVTEHYGPGQ